MNENSEQSLPAGGEPKGDSGRPTRTAAIASLASGALAFGIAGRPSSASAETEAEMTHVDGQKLLSSLKRAGMDPRKIDLPSLVGSRPDLHELQARLTGAPSEMKRSETKWTVVIDGVNKF